MFWKAFKSTIDIKNKPTNISIREAALLKHVKRIGNNEFLHSSRVILLFILKIRFNFYITLKILIN